VGEQRRAPPSSDPDLGFPPELPGLGKQKSITTRKLLAEAFTKEMAHKRHHRLIRGSRVSPGGNLVCDRHPSH
jgi:hypothetical protein